jgi:hypothetical protein
MAMSTTGGGKRSTRPGGDDAAAKKPEEAGEQRPRRLAELLRKAGAALLPSAIGMRERESRAGLTLPLGGEAEHPMNAPTEQGANVKPCPAESGVTETATSTSETPSAKATEKRRSTRVVQAVPIIVIGTDALGQSFRESTSTVMVDCYGCKIQSRNYAPKNSTLILEIFHAPGWERRTVRGRVVWVQRPRTHRENFQIAMEMEVPGNVWGIAPPPADWFAHPDDLAPAAIEVSDPGTGEVGEYVSSATKEDGASEKSGEGDPLEADGPVHASGADPGGSETAEEIAAAQAEVDPGAEDEFTFTREQLDGQIHDAIGSTIQTMIERAAEAAVRDLVQDISERTAALVEAARKVSQEAAEEVDARVRQTLDETLRSLQIELPKPGAPKRRRRGAKRR